MSLRLFVTGTDTDAGKTYVSCLILRALSARGERVSGFKPFCSGGRADAEQLRAAGSAPPPELNTINPCWWHTAAAPPVAARIENRPADLDAVRAAYLQIQYDFPHFLVEGVGGWLAPLTDTQSVADYAAELDLPVLVIAANRLGAINHTRLTVERIVKDGLTCAGVILNSFLSDEDENADLVMAHNRAVLEQCLAVPVLGEVTRGQSQLDSAILDKLLETT